jgi:methionyl-tRNA formyltransferase
VRVVFMGTPDFAVPTLRALAVHHEVVAVFSRPDAVSGRGGKTRPSAISALAAELDIPIHQPATLRDPVQLELVRSVHADIIIVAAYGLIIPGDVLEAPRLGSVNVHASLLPRWRGAAPIQRAILAGDEIAGVSIMRMEVGLDTGPYCSQGTTPVAEKNAVALTAEVAQLGADALIAALPSIEDGSAIWVVQDESLVTYADKVSKSDVAISPDLPVHEIIHRVRASLPAAPSRVTLGGRSVTVLDVVAAEVPAAAGTVVCTKSSLLLGALDGAVELSRIKPDGKAEMDACAWARGVRDLDGASWQGV